MKAAFTILTIILMFNLLSPLVTTRDDANAMTPLVPLACVAAEELGFESWNWNQMCYYALSYPIIDDPWNYD